MKVWTPPKDGATVPPADVTIYEVNEPPGDQAPPSGVPGKTFALDMNTGILYRLESL